MTRMMSTTEKKIAYEKDEEKKKMIEKLKDIIELEESSVRVIHIHPWLAAQNFWWLKQNEMQLLGDDRECLQAH